MLGFSNRQNKVESLDATVNTTDYGNSSIDKDKLLIAIEGVSHGNTSSCDDIDTSLGMGLKNIAESISEKDTDLLKCVVNYSINSSDFVANTARLIVDIGDVNTNIDAMVAATEEISVSTSQLADNSINVSNDAGSLSELAKDGMEEVERASNAMDQINSVVTNMASRLSVLEQAAGQIGGMAQSIEDISNQTKLLALNATIEAARAGEAGKGFAVVASEVKSLSEQTSKATDHIRGLIETLNNEMKEMGVAMNEGDITVSKGEGTVREVGNKINLMNEQIEAVAGGMAEVSSVLEQQSEASNEISQRVSNISENVREAENKANHVISIAAKSSKFINDKFDMMDKMDIKNYILYRAKSDHLLWKKNLAETIAGINKMDHRDLADHHSCRLGKWYDNVTDSAITSCPDFKNLVTPHEKVHTHGKNVAKAVENEDLKLAIEEYGKMEQASIDVVHILDLIISQVR